jgi:DNA-binding protein HU-beta
MTKAELIFTVSGATDIPPEAVRRALNAIVDSIVEVVGSGDSVSIPGFGTFSSKHRAERIGRNPRTGELMEIPACNVPVFKPGNQLKDAVSGK